MKLTKGNVTKLLTNNGVSKSKTYRGRITQEATEGFLYANVTFDSIVISYRNRTSSFASRETWLARHTEKIQQIVEVINANGFVATTDGHYVTITKG